MGKIKGQNEWSKFRKGEALTRKQAILAYCYECNGWETSSGDCRAIKSCPLYQHSSFRG